MTKRESMFHHLKMETRGNFCLTGQTMSKNINDLYLISYRKGYVHKPTALYTNSYVPSSILYKTVSKCITQYLNTRFVYSSKNN